MIDYNGLSSTFIKLNRYWQTYTRGNCLMTTCSWVITDAKVTVKNEDDLGEFKADCSH